MERKQGIYLNDERVSAGASRASIGLVDRIVRAIVPIIGNGEVGMEIWSRGRLAKKSAYSILEGVVEEVVLETLPKV
jgi:phosphopantothenate synthetase